MGENEKEESERRHGRIKGLGKKILRKLALEKSK